jgi:sugar phosphate isomerase/epimerase
LEKKRDDASFIEEELFRLSGLSGADAETLKRELVAAAEVMKKYGYALTSEQPGYMPVRSMIPLGCVAWSPEKSKDDLFRFLSKYQYETVELVANLEDLDKLLQTKCQELKELQKRYSIRVTAAMYIANMFHPDPVLRNEIYGDVKKTIQILEELEAPVMVTHPAYETPGKPLEELWRDFAGAYAELVDYAEEHNVKMAVETSRHRHVKCIAYNVPTYQRLFDMIPSRNIGVNFDPSHCVWMGLDILNFVRIFGDRLYGFHAKDTEILGPILGDYGNIDGDKMLWWRFRIPGWGAIDWRKLVTALRDVGYKYDIHVEAEDPIFSQDEALARAAEYLGPILGSSWPS